MNILETDGFQCFFLPYVFLNDFFGITIIIHRDKDVFQDVYLVNLVVQVKERVSFVHAVFYEYSTTLIYNTTSVYDNKALVVKAVHFNELIYA